MLYAVIARLLSPLTWWGRLRVEGVDAVPQEGPFLVVANHDSQMDPVVIGLALRRRRRLRFLARASLWRIPALGPVMDRTDQIPIERGASDAGALDRAVAALAAGDGVGVFPEGRLSEGRQLRARRGVARLARACPDAPVVLCAVEGTTDYVRFPRRPRTTVRFFAPQSPAPRRPEDDQLVASHWLGELRLAVAPAASGRHLPPAAPALANGRAMVGS